MITRVRSERDSFYNLILSTPASIISQKSLTSDWYYHVVNYSCCRLYYLYLNSVLRFTVVCTTRLYCTPTVCTTVVWLSSGYFWIIQCVTGTVVQTPAALYTASTLVVFDCIQVWQLFMGCNGFTKSLLHDMSVIQLFFSCFPYLQPPVYPRPALPLISSLTPPLSM